jgi:hypothetical protein
MAIQGSGRNAQGIYRVRPPLLRQNPVNITTNQTSRKAPVQGWNVRDSLADMDIGFAVRLDNWIPREDKVEVRPGYTGHATGAGAAVQSLMQFTDPTTDILLSASGTTVYNVTNTGTATTLSSSFTSGLWQYENFNGNLMMVNGEDTPQLYSGSTLSNASLTGSGLTAGNLINVWVHANRLWFIEKNTMKAWYLPVENIGGTVTAFRLDFYTALGGYLMAGGTWSREGGAGPQDLNVFVTSEGEVLVYSGTNPASDYQIVGRYLIGKPIGRRCLMKLGSELMILTQDGYVNLSAVLGADRAFIDRAISDPIRPAVREAYRDHGAKLGWHAIQWADQNIVLVNVPTREGAAAEQHVVNTITGAWCRLTDLPIVSFSRLGNDLYFGNGAGEIFRMASDQRSDNGNPINAVARPAYDYLNARGRLKTPTLIRHQIESDGDFTATIALDRDFRDDGAESLVSVTSAAGTAWDTALWDTFGWGDSVVSNDWHGAAGQGYSFSPRLEVSVNNVRPSWVAYDLAWQNGGIL